MNRLVLLCSVLIACSPPPAQNAKAPAQTTITTPDSGAAAQVATIGIPQAGARVTSPLRISGIAPANWYFENQFPVRLLDARGDIIAEAPAHPDVNWTENAEPKAFALDLPFRVTTETAAMLVLQEDMPREGEAPREVRMAVVLAPGG